MIPDLVERLRAMRKLGVATGLELEAADKIERLMADNEALRRRAMDADEDTDLRAEIERLRAENVALRAAILNSDDAHWTTAMRAALRMKCE